MCCMFVHQDNSAEKLDGVVLVTTSHGIQGKRGEGIWKAFELSLNKIRVQA